MIHGNCIGSGSIIHKDSVGAENKFKRKAFWLNLVLRHDFYGSKPHIFIPVASTTSTLLVKT